MKNVRGWWLPDSDTHIAEKIQEQSNTNRGFNYQTQQRDYALSFALKYASRNKVAIDIGGHVGLWSVDMANHFKELIIFEPVEENKKCLIKNLAARDIKNYKLYGCVLGEGDGSVNLNTDDKNTGNPYISDKGDYPAKMRTLDSFYFDRVDFIKIDVEGYEMNVLLGAEHTIRTCKPILVLETKDKHYERYGTSFRKIQDWLEKRNYKIDNVVNSEAIFVDKDLPTRTYFASKHIWEENED